MVHVERDGGRVLFVDGLAAPGATLESLRGACPVCGSELASGLLPSCPVCDGRDHEVSISGTVA